MASAGNTSKAAAALSDIYKHAGRSAKAVGSGHALTQRLMGGLAASLIAQMGITPETSSPLSLLDSACGSGAFTCEIQNMLNPAVLEKSNILCADNSEALVESTRSRIAAENWINTKARVLDAMNTGLPESSFSHVAIALALHLIPDPDAVLRDCKQVLRHGGVFGATTFHEDNGSLFWYPDIKAAFDSLPFDAPMPEKVKVQIHDSGRWYDPDWIQKHLEEQGFRDVQVKVNLGKVRLAGAEEFVAMFGSMINWMANTNWSPEVRDAHPMEEVTPLIEKHLDEKHGGQPWDVEWKMISMTGMVD